MICRLRGWWETVMWFAFWRSLVQPPLVVVSGHVWPEVTKWSSPMASPDPDAWNGLVEYDLSTCVICGYAAWPLPWRRSYAVA